jgi:hypothetical protein
MSNTFKIDDKVTFTTASRWGVSAAANGTITGINETPRGTWFEVTNDATNVVKRVRATNLTAR